MIFACPQCKTNLQTDEQQTGNPFCCPHCHANGLIPSRVAPAAPAGVQVLMSFPCPQCRQSIQCPSDYAGQTIQCGSCQRQIAAPHLLTQPTSPSAAFEGLGDVVGDRPNTPAGRWSMYGTDALYVAGIAAATALMSMIPCIGWAMFFVAGIMALLGVIFGVSGIVNCRSTSTSGLWYSCLAVVISLIIFVGWIGITIQLVLAVKGR